MKNSSRSGIVIQQPTKKYLIEKGAMIEMKDQNDNQTQNNAKEEPFLIENHQVENETKRRTIHCSNGLIELDENGNVIPEVKRSKRSLKTIAKHRNWLNAFDSVDSSALDQATNIGSSVGRKILSAIDYIGGILASFIGITGSKYEKECLQADFEKKERERRENVIRDAESGWKPN